MGWSVGTDSAGRAIVCDRRHGAEERFVCRPSPCMEDGLSATDVANLIAAAPSLLRELKRLLSMWEESIGYEDAYMSMGDRARKAISMAEGRADDQ